MKLYHKLIIAGIALQLAISTFILFKLVRISGLVAEMYINQL